MSTPRLFLSPPHMCGAELEFVKEAFASNYIAPLGPMVDAFEKEFASYTGIPYCLALSSGTAAMHLALRHLSNPPLPGEQHEQARPVVLASTLTFIGSVTSATIENLELRFIDCDRESWNMDPVLLETELEECARIGKQVLAVVPTDLYGQCCNLPVIRALCDRYHVPVICDSAESVGSHYSNPSASEKTCLHSGFDAWAAVYSFNGNKIITTSGGGVLASHDKELIAHARKLSTQARDQAPHYEHTEIGFNYRMSNIVAAIGRGQLQALDERVQQRRGVFEAYKRYLDGLPGISFMPEPDWSRANRWLTVIQIDPDLFGADSSTVREALDRENIEARPVWKPMHLQPVFKGCRVRGGTVSEELFSKGLCLPSGTAMTDSDVRRVCDMIEKRHTHSSR